MRVTSSGSVDPIESRGERKERTRRAILDAALGLTEQSSLVALSLRQVAKEVGVVPTAFYRHFDSIEALGLALVDESFESLRDVLRGIRRRSRDEQGRPVYGDIVDQSVDSLVEQVHDKRQHFRFLARERSAGPPTVRAAIAHQIELVERELATDLARLPGTSDWDTEDLYLLANLIVTQMVASAERLIEVADRPDLEKRIGEGARTQLRMVLVGAINWRSAP